MKTITISALLFIAICMMSTTMAPWLSYKEAKVAERFVELRYEISNPGYVELHLMDRDRKELWVKGKVHDSAKDMQHFRIPRKPLKGGERYSFLLKYKGKDYKGSFFNE